MKANVQTGIRIVALVFVAVVLQLAIVSQIDLFGSNADLLPLVALAVGLRAGPIPGSVTGFLLGLVADMALIQTLGVTSLLLIAVGYLAGRYRELRDTSHALLPIVAGLAATLVYGVGFAVVQFLLGVQSPVSGLLARDIVITALLNSAVAIPTFAAVRAWLGTSITDDLRSRRPAARLRMQA